MLLSLVSLTVCIAIGYLAYFLYSPIKRSIYRAHTANIALHQAKLAELAQDVDTATLSPSELDAGRADIARTLAHEVDSDEVVAQGMTSGELKYALIGVITFICLSGSALYYSLGTPDIQQRLAGLDGIKTISELVDYVAAHPNDLDAVKALALAYFSQEQFEKSKEMYAKAYQLDPEDVTVLVEYAGVLATLQNNDLSGQPAALIRQALILDENNVSALYLTGILAYSQGHLDVAKFAWSKALAQLPATSQDYADLAQQLAELNAEMAQYLSSTLATPTPSATKQVAVTVTILVSDALKSRFLPDDFVLVYAKASDEQQQIPLAIKKLRLSDLPTVLVLSDANSMVPAYRLSSAERIVVVARVSKSGQATKQAGDVEVTSNVVNLSEQSTASTTLLLP